MIRQSAPFRVAMAAYSCVGASRVTIRLPFAWNTADLFTGISRGADKSLWMAEAHVQDAREDEKRVAQPSAAREAPRSGAVSP